MHNSEYDTAVIKFLQAMGMDYREVVEFTSTPHLTKFVVLNHDEDSDAPTKVVMVGRDIDLTGVEEEDEDRVVLQKRVGE